MRRLVLGLLAAAGLAFGASALTPAQTSLVLSAPTGPSLDLNLTAGPLDSRISFTRASSGSSFNSAGVLVSNAANVPRFDYNPVTLAPLGLLIEEARTNAVFPSTTGAWSYTANGGTSAILVGSATSPDGTLDASTVTFSTNSFIFTPLTTPAIASGTTATFSAYVRQSGASPAANIRLTTNNGTSWSTGTSQRFALTAGWQRIVLAGSLTTSGTTTKPMIGALDATGADDALCHGNVDVFGAQLEVGAFATSYIPTTSAAATRAADFASVPAGPWFNASAGTLVATGIFRTLSATQNTELIALGSDGNNLIRAFIGNGGNALVSQDFVLGANQLNQFASPTVFANVSTKAGFAYSVPANAMSLGNAGTVSSGSAAAFPAVSTLFLGGSNSRGLPLDGTISAIRYWPRAQGAAELAGNTR